MKKICNSSRLWVDYGRNGQAATDAASVHRVHSVHLGRRLTSQNCKHGLAYEDQAGTVIEGCL